MPAIDVAGEFETIQRLLKPLAHPEWARGLADDVAALPSRPGHDLILTKDAIVEGAILNLTLQYHEQQKDVGHFAKAI
jgi:thiamine-monophosphate kinase